MPLEKVTTPISDAFSKALLYPIVEVALFDAIYSYEGAERGEKGKCRVVQQFPILHTRRKGSDFTVDFTCGIVKVCL